MISWLIMGAALYLLLSMKVGVRLLWESNTATIKLRIGAFRFSFPTNEKKRNDKKKGTVTPKPASRENSLDTKKWIQALLAHWQEALSLVAKILRTPNLDLLRLRVVVGGTDPEACAMQYGRLCAGLGAGLPLVQRLFSIKKQDIDVRCHFEKAETEILAEVELTVFVYEVLALLFAGLALLIKLYRHTKSTEKAVGSK